MSPIIAKTIPVAGPFMLFDVFEENGLKIAGDLTFAQVQDLARRRGVKVSWPERRPHVTSRP